MSYLIGGVRSVSTGPYLVTDTDASGNVTVHFSDDSLSPIAQFQKVLTDSDIGSLTTPNNIIFDGNLGTNGVILAVVLEYIYGGEAPYTNLGTGDLAIYFSPTTSGPQVCIGNSLGLLDHAADYPNNVKTERIVVTPGLLITPGGSGGIYIKNTSGVNYASASDLNTLKVSVLVGLAR